MCRTCAVTQQQEKCNHTNDEGAFTGTWCTNKIVLAFKKGYRVLEIFEVWHFDKTTDTLFKGYVRNLMKPKMVSSTPPDEDINVFKQRVRDHLGIELGEIKKNPGMRQVAKLCLNSLWGKYGQRINQTQTEYITEPKDFYKIFLNETHEIIQDPSKTVTIEKKNAITQDAKTKTIVNQDLTKTFSLGYDKCVVQSNFDTLPYGY